MQSDVCTEVDIRWLFLNSSAEGGEFKTCLFKQELTNDDSVCKLHKYQTSTKRLCMDFSVKQSNFKPTKLLRQKMFSYL